MDKTKVCSKCGIEKPSNEGYFYTRKKGNAIWLSSICKSCTSLENKKYREKNKENLREYNRKYYNDNKEILAEYNKKYYKENKDSLSANNKVYRKENADSIKAQRKGYYDENKEEISKKGKKYRQENSERCKNTNKTYYDKNREDIIKWNREYYKDNRDVLLLQKQQYYKINKERIKQYYKKWRESNRDVEKKHTHNRNARKRNLKYTLTLTQWDDIKELFNRQCAYCGMLENESISLYKEPLHQEHFIALTNNGEYTHNNIIPSCKSCNSSKSNKNFFEWYPSYNHYSKKRESFILEYLGYEKESNTQQLSIL